MASNTTLKNSLKNKNRTLYGIQNDHDLQAARSQQSKCSKEHRTEDRGWKSSLTPQLTKARVDVEIGDEDPVDFEELRAALMEQYDPQGAAECELVEYLAAFVLSAPACSAL
jgi:hypothetical protein